MAHVDYLEFEEEPTITLLDGTEILRAVFDLVRRLQATGHTVTIDADTTVRVTPMVDEDVWYMLDSNWGDVEKALDAEQPSTLIAITPTAVTIH